MGCDMVFKRYDLMKNLGSILNKLFNASGIGSKISFECHPPLFEIITPSVTDVGCVMPIILMGHTPVPTDIDKNSFNINWICDQEFNLKVLWLNLRDV